jgi:hypothetical protein
MNAFTDTPHALHAPSSMRRPARSRRERCVALVDARYLAWLADQDDAARPRLDRLQACLEAALDAQAFPAEISRLYWYASERPERVLPGIVHRWVAPEMSDAGASLTLAMARDLMGLAEHPGYDRVVLLTDDDRLLPVIDALKLAGLTVCLLADERAQSMARMMQQDPTWARLLREADRRIVVRSSELAQALLARPGAVGDGPVSADLDARLQLVVQAWWDDLVEDDRDTLREELPGQRGLPPEVDRELLVRAKNAIGRSLNFQEKRVLRAQARRGHGARVG